MQTRLLETKFHIPPQRAAGVSRPRLVELLDTGLQDHCRLILVSAPAGYGKTTLVVDWLQSVKLPCRIAWLSLESGDNDATRFVNYWINAIQRVVPCVEKQTQALLGMPNISPLPALIDELINCLSAIEQRFLLVLDDYHAINNQQIHEALEYFLDHLPAHVHMVITTRQDPPLPLARMRARSQMIEIRARDLRFTHEEAYQFFSHSIKLDIAQDDINILEERTEGWVAGLQLAGLALQHLADPQRFIETFRGSHRYVLDYLAEEVIRQQGEEIRTFLTQTSILERFNAAVCSALTGRMDSQAVIEYLEQANLFIVPLDDERIWYRYHHLFSVYLRTLLTQTEQDELYKKASAWHESNSLMSEAVPYALACHDADFATSVIERVFIDNATWSGGNVALWLSWLEALPVEAFHTRPSLCINASRIYYLSGHFELAEKYIDQAEKSLQALPGYAEGEQILALAALYRGSIAAVRRDVQQAIEQITYAESRLSKDNHLAHARAFFSLGLAYEVSDQTGRAVENYLSSSEEAKSAGVLFLAIHALCAAAQVHITQGRLHLAEQICQAAIQLAEGERIAPLGLADVILGGIALERNNLNIADGLLQDGITLARLGGLMDDVIVGLALLGRLRAYQGDLVGMQVVIDEVQSIMRAFGIPRMEQLADAHLARFQHFLGLREAAVRWAKDYQDIRAEPLREFEELTLSRILLSTGETQAVLGILHPILEKAAAAGRMQTCLETMMLIGLYHRARGDTTAALEWLQKSLELAAPEGYIRLFLDEGKPLLELLPRLRPAAPGLVDTLLGSKQAPAESRSAHLDRLSVPLSEQEMRVLNLIIEGKSNAEIAAELVISVGTAKWHVHNILQKLGVKNRPQAIALVRQA